VKNEGAPGVDGLTVAEFKPWLQAHWKSIRQALWAGEYLPAAVGKVDIPKAQGGVRTRGIRATRKSVGQRGLNDNPGGYIHRTIFIANEVNRGYRRELTQSYARPVIHLEVHLKSREARDRSSENHVSFREVDD
jgi:hypothetical protein